MTIYITITASKLLLSILYTEHKTLTLGEWVISTRNNIEDYKQLDFTTLEGA